MVVSLRGVKAASRRLRGGLRASLDPSTLKADAVRDTCKKWSQGFFERERLRMEREILKKAAAFFAKESA